MKIFFVLSVLYSAAFAAPRIVGGTETDITEIPYQLELDWLILDWWFTCGAVVIGPNSALTSARCVDKQRADEVGLRAGATKREKGDSHTVIDIVIHPNFTKRPDDIPENDLAFLVVDPPFIFSESIQPIKLAETTPNDDDDVVISGWGYTSENSWYSDNLLSANVPIVNKEHCADDLEVDITPDMICAGNILGTRDTCTGDTGGPLTVNKTLAGITSWGLGCGGLHRPRVYVHVAHFKDWIDEQQQLLDKKLQKL